MTPKQSKRSERKLNKLRENKLEELAKKLDSDIRGYDHIVEYADNHTAVTITLLNMQIIILQVFVVIG